MDIPPLALPSSTHIEDIQPQKRSQFVRGEVQQSRVLATTVGGSVPAAMGAAKLSPSVSLPNIDPQQCNLGSSSRNLTKVANYSELEGKDFKLPPSVVSHRSITPTPDISTSPDGKGYKPRAGTAITPPKLLSQSVTSPAQVTAENALANLSLASSSTRSSGATSMRIKTSSQESLSISKISSHMASSYSTTSSASTPGSSSSGASHKTWSKLKPLNARDAILHTIQIDTIEKTALPKDAERVWYLGFVDTWKHFHGEALKFWENAKLRSAFNEISRQPMSPPRTNSSPVAQSASSQERLEEQVQCKLVEVVREIANMLLLTHAWHNQEDTTAELSLIDAQDEDLGNNEYSFKPTFVISAMLQNGDDESRLLGHVEYFDGVPGALSRAVETRAKNAWGNLRCVLGECCAMTNDVEVY
jgi:hypothetical protein